MFNRINNKMHKKNKVISQINVTPFVDVMLVLLIVFNLDALTRGEFYTKNYI